MQFLAGPLVVDITFAVRGVDGQVLCLTTTDEELARLIYHPHFWDEPEVQARHIQQWIQSHPPTAYYPDFHPRSRWVYVVDLVERTTCSFIEDKEFYTRGITATMYGRVQGVLQRDVLEYIDSLTRKGSDYRMPRYRWRDNFFYSTASGLRDGLVRQGFSFSLKESAEWSSWIGEVSNL